jgi:hypothetical protein
MNAPVPEYFEYLRDAGEKSRVYPLYYDESTKWFELGGLPIPLTDFDPYGMSPVSLGIEDRDLEIDELAYTPLMLPSFGPVIVGPKLHVWAYENPDRVANTARVMHEAFITFMDDPEEIPFSNDGGFMGFAAGLREGGGIGLQVMGNCACMGPDPNGFLIRDRMEVGFAEYDLHNADSQAQRASLFAGLGHMARLSVQREPAQKQLF